MPYAENLEPGRAETRAAESPSFGIIIPDRDRTSPLRACLAALAAQDMPPAWVVLSDLSSQPPHRAELVRFADRYQVSYLRIDYDEEWNKSLAFNTAFRLALRSLPGVSHVIQLDADVIAHPRLLSTTAATLGAAVSGPASASCYCAPRLAPPHLEIWTADGELAEYGRLLAQSGPVESLACGACMVLPADWLARERGFDESFTGWGHEDSELWFRVRNSLTHSEDLSGTQLIHQWHERQPGAGQAGPNWMSLLNRLANRAHQANPDGWGNGRIAESVLRTGLLRTRPPETAGQK